jgi:AraC-like DNA-binding protein
MHYAWERRLVRCRRDLTDPPMSHGEIAIAAGFKDLSHFSHAYRALRVEAASTAQQGEAAMASPQRYILLKGHRTRVSHWTQKNEPVRRP